MRFGDSHRLETAIRSARDQARELSPENQSRLAQIMTIWGSGYLETTCREVLNDYAERRADPTVARFVGQTLERFRNPNMTGIVDLVRAFDRNIAAQLEDFASGNIKESINSMVALRHQIAHGRSTDTTIYRASAQFEAAKRLADKLRNLLDVEGDGVVDA